MSMNTIVLSSVRHDWETPQDLFDHLDREFLFTLDACANETNAKVLTYFSPEIDGLKQNWTGRVWMNPPYGYGIGEWVKKAYEESQVNAEVVVMLIPSRTETSWWHRFVMEAAEIRLIRGRLRFSGMTINAPFPSVVVVFRPGKHLPMFTTMDRNPGANP